MNESQKICPMCQSDYTDRDVTFVWSNILKSEICMYCELEYAIDIMYEEGSLGGTYIDLAMKVSGLDCFECKRLFLEQIVSKIKSILVGDFSVEEKKHRQWNFQHCLNQVRAIEKYQKALNTGNADNIIARKQKLDEAFQVQAFGTDLILGGSVNHLTD